MCSLWGVVASSPGHVKVQAFREASAIFWYCCPIVSFGHPRPSESLFISLWSISCLLEHLNAIIILRTKSILSSRRGFASNPPKTCSYPWSCRDCLPKYVFEKGGNRLEEAGVFRLLHNFCTVYWIAGPYRSCCVAMSCRNNSIVQIYRPRQQPPHRTESFRRKHVVEIRGSSSLCHDETAVMQ